MTNGESPKPTASLEEVDSLPQLFVRPARVPDYEREHRALGLLAEEMAAAPRNMPQKLVEIAVALG